MRNGFEDPPVGQITEHLVKKTPVEKMFEILSTRIDPDDIMDVHETVHYYFKDTKERYVLTMRRGILEVVKGDPIPGTPDPMATFISDSNTFKKIAIKLKNPVKAYASGEIKVEGSWVKFIRFMSRIESDL